MSLIRSLVRPLVRRPVRTPARRGTGGGPLIDDVDALAWIAAVTANSGTVGPATRGAVQTFIKAAKASAYWTKINRLNLFCGDQLAACLVPQKVGGGSATDTNFNFVSGDYSESTGLTGNGTSKYLDTGLSQATFGAGDRHLSAYERVRAVPQNGEMLGCEPGGVVNTWAMGTGIVTTTQYFGSSTATGPSSTGNVVGGHWVGNQVLSTEATIYKNGGSGVLLAGLTGATPGAANMAIFARKRAPSTLLRYSAATLSAYSVGTGLSAGDVAAFYTHMQAFQTSLGRQV